MRPRTVLLALCGAALIVTTGGINYDSDVDTFVHGWGSPPATVYDHHYTASTSAYGVSPLGDVVVQADYEQSYACNGTYLVKGHEEDSEYGPSTAYVSETLYNQTLPYARVSAKHVILANPSVGGGTHYTTAKNC